MIRFRAAGFPALLALVCLACDRTPPAPLAQRFVDLYEPSLVDSRVAPEAPPPRVEWRFDGPGSKKDEQGAQTRGWRALNGIEGLAVRDGRLVGRTTSDLPILNLALDPALEDPDTLHEVEVRLSVSAGANAMLDFSREKGLDEKKVLESARDFPWSFSSPVVAGEETRTYLLRTPFSERLAGAHHVHLRPTDQAGATFAIESVRRVSRREHLAGVPSGVGWQGLSEIYRETIVSRAPEKVRLELTLPPRPWLDLAVGTPEDGPVTFRLAVAASARSQDETVVLERTVTRAHRWEEVGADLSRFAGRKVALTLSLAAEKRGALGFWGAPAVRDRGSRPLRAAAQSKGRTPQGVIVIWADTLRRDHLGAYGYKRDTSPFIDRLAREGALFKDAVSQASWTKVSTPSLLTSLYPTQHGVKDFTDRLPSSGTTLAEVYREAGYATVCLSSVLFIGKLTNLHQGFEVLHEDGSLPDRGSSKTAREYVDRLTAWLETHQGVPFFAFLHVTDAHDPYKPYRPWDTLYADGSHAEQHERHAKEVRKFIADPLLKLFGMPNRAELEKGGLDADAYVAHDKDWYDGSIRGMDAEIARLFERLRTLGLDDKTLVVFTSDHGEEFLEHGRMFHGQNVYGHQNNVPLILWGPGIPKGRVIEDTVQSIDVMPTLLEASGLRLPSEAQGRSLFAFMTTAGEGGRVHAAPESHAAFSEKAETSQAVGAPPPRDTSSQAIVLDGFKLVHNRKRPAGQAEYELYDHRRDPLNLSDIAASRPEIVERLKRELVAWRRSAEAARLKPDSHAEKALSRDELERLRALGYIQ
jgi:arylsulfatase A-like enzyme